MNTKALKNLISQDITQAIEVERVKMLYENLGVTPYSYYAWYISLFTVMYLSDANAFWLGTWVIAIVTIQIVQRRNEKKFSVLKTIDNTSVWERNIMITVGFEALIISSGMMLSLDFDQNLLAYTGVAMIVIPAYLSVVPLVASISTQRLWIFLMLMPVVIKFLGSGEVFGWIFGVTLLIAGVPIAILLGKQLSETLIDTLRLRYENNELLAIAQREAQRAEKASDDKMRFLASASHDLRQPLHALDLFLGGLKNRLQAEENIKLLGNAQASSRALGDLLNALLDVSRLDANEVAVHKQILPLLPLLQESCNELTPVALAKGLALKLRCADNIYINTDAVLLTRALRNYILNAIRYTKQGSILVGVRKCGSDVRIEVWDRGKGIGDKQQEHIFDEYYQIGNSERDSEKGLGLGLAIVKRLSDLLGHPIGFKSKLGRGSCFYITAPQGSLSDYIAPKMNELGNNSQDLTGLFVLVIDDHQAILDGMRNILRDWGCEILMGQSLGEILDELQAFDYPIPDVMLVDYRLRNNETGDVAIDTIRHFFKADIPAVLMTGEMAHGIEKLADSIQVELMRKPVSTEELKRLLYQYKAIKP